MELSHDKWSGRLDFGQTMFLPASLGSCEIDSARRCGGTDLRRPLNSRRRERRNAEARSGQSNRSEQADGGGWSGRRSDESWPFINASIIRWASTRLGDPDGVRREEAGDRGGRPALAPDRLVALDLAMPASAAATPEPFGSPEILGFPDQGSGSIGQNTIALTLRLSEPIRLLTTPLLALLDPASDAMTMIHALLGLIWLILVWGICGGAIARLATIQEAQMRQPGIARRTSIRPSIGDRG